VCFRTSSEDRWDSCTSDRRLELPPASGGRCCDRDNCARIDLHLACCARDLRRGKAPTMTSFCFPSTLLRQFEVGDLILLQANLRFDSLSTWGGLKCKHRFDCRRANHDNEGMECRGFLLAAPFGRQGRSKAHCFVWPIRDDQ